MTEIRILKNSSESYVTYVTYIKIENRREKALSFEKYADAHVYARTLVDEITPKATGYTYIDMTKTPIIAIHRVFDKTDEAREKEMNRISRMRRGAIFEGPGRPDFVKGGAKKRSTKTNNKAVPKP